jgi:Rod binding domain-containing protein
MTAGVQGPGGEPRFLPRRTPEPFAHERHATRGGDPVFVPAGGKRGDERAKAEKTAAQFEQLFVRAMVSSLRASGSLGEQGMFGQGAGSDTFGDWFDDNLAQQIAGTTSIGIKDALLADLERHREIPVDAAAQELAAKAQAARAAADRTRLHTPRLPTLGGIDVVSR